jgi:hypothetical protein
MRYVRVNSTFGPKGRFLCVAVSNDTLTWTKPIINNVAFENSTENSACYYSGSDCNTIIDQYCTTIDQYTKQF